MTEEEQLPRLRATRAGNKGVVTKLIAETEGIPHGPYSLDEKTRNRLARIKKVLKEKTELIHDLDEKIIAVCKVEDIKEEIENAEDLKMRVMDAIEAISIGTTPTTPFNSSSSSNLTATSRKKSNRTEFVRLVAATNSVAATKIFTKILQYTQSDLSLQRC